MSSYVSVQITCPHCNTAHRFALLPEGEAVKESGGKHSHETQTPEELAEKIQEPKGKPSERTDAIRRQLTDLKAQGEQSQKLLTESIEEDLLQRQGKTEKKDHAPKLSTKRRSRLLSGHLKDHPENARKPKSSALLDSKLHIHDMAAMLAGKSLAQ